MALQLNGHNSYCENLFPDSSDAIAQACRFPFLQAFSACKNGILPGKMIRKQRTRMTPVGLAERRLRMEQQR